METTSRHRSSISERISRSKSYAVSAAKIAGIYLIVGGLWILLTDRVLLLVMKSPSQLTDIQTYKGWVFVLGTALLIFTLCSRHLAEAKGHHEQEKSLRHQLESFAWQTAATLAKTVERKDGYTGEHCERIARRAETLGREMGLDKERLTNLYYAGLVHDIGKVEIPDAVLNKSGQLTDEEWEEMKRHVEIGADLLQPIRPLRPVARIVEQHHESWDGNGYPNGLAGEEIALEARILSVVDAYDAMTTDRPYREALSDADARAELERHAGTQFDPQVVAAFLKYVADRVGEADGEA